MSDWVALLRGVNVGGVTVRRADLKATVEALGLERVRTVLATGNVLFSAPDVGTPGPDHAPRLRVRLEEALSARFGYDAHVVLLPRARLAAIVDGYPFPEDAEHHAYVVFGSDPAVLSELADLAAAADPATDPVAPGPDVLYWRCPKGSTLTTPFSKALARARFKESTTNRNLNTVRKLV